MLGCGNREEGVVSERKGRRCCHCKEAMVWGGCREAQKPSHHPLHQIAESLTHKLLLKQWLKEEELISRRVALKEARIDAVRKEITTLYCTFFFFHSIILLLLYSTAVALGPSGHACHRSWIPCLCSLLCSMAIVWAIRYKTDTESLLQRLLEREKEDGILLMKCVAELKKKGVEFDLLKEVDALRRAKSLRIVEAKGGTNVLFCPFFDVSETNPLWELSNKIDCSAISMEL
ncbi:hypothetical protein COCNU_08G006040 [Cocos nucifera]|uniref:Uncharacterized protein n=1 Tax=Cocos nucifera TaxID=13894 RepID=A0A8K0N5R0_COCNU|nr:hypothetical protein COCNU_08G006040 [Cocos nucifera]